MTSDVDRLRKRIDRRLGEAEKLDKDIDKLFEIIEERGQLIDTLARQIEQENTKRDMAEDDCEMYKQALSNLEVENERLREKVQEIVDGEDYYKGKETAIDYDGIIEAICEELRDALIAR